MLQQISVSRRDVLQFCGLHCPTSSHVGWIAISANLVGTFAWRARCRFHRNCNFSWDVSLFLQRYQPPTRCNTIAKCTFLGSSKRPSSKKKRPPKMSLIRAWFLVIVDWYFQVFCNNQWSERGPMECSSDLVLCFLVVFREELGVKRAQTWPTVSLEKYDYSWEVVHFLLTWVPEAKGKLWE